MTTSSGAIGRLTPQQKELITHLMQEYPHLRTRQVGGDVTNNSIRRDWEEVASQLNGVPGGVHKSWQQWRRAWQDLRKTNIHKRAAMRRSAQATGGGSAVPISWTPDDEAIAEMITETIVSGDRNVLAASIPFEFVRNPPLTPPPATSAPDITTQEAGPSTITDHRYSIPKRSPRKIRTRVPTRVARLQQSQRTTEMLMKQVEKRDQEQRMFQNSVLAVLEALVARMAQLQGHCPNCCPRNDSADNV